MNLLIAFGLGVLGAVPCITVGKEKERLGLARWLVMSVIFTLVMWWYLYGALPSFAGPFWGMTLPMLAMWVVAIWVTAVANSDVRNWGIGPGALLPVILAAVAGIRGCAGSAMVSASDRRDAAGEVEVLADTSKLKSDQKHIRMVSWEQAAWLANKALGDKPGEALGSRFHVGFLTLQMVKGEFQYVGALEYNGFRHWSSSEGTPGYVTVSATDPSAQPTLVTERGGGVVNLRYMPSAYFGDNLERHVFNAGYRTYEINDYHFELDDNESPWWIVTLTRPTVHYAVEKIQLVLLVDPTTGKIEEHTLADLPTWVDRAVPENLAVTYLSWWGEFQKGWINSWWDKRGVVEPTVNQIGESNSAERVSLVYGSDNQAYWFTGMTSTASTDQALVSGVMMNSRTGQVKQLTMTGANEVAVMSAANAAVRNFAGQHATSPIPYHIYGETVWVVPMLSETHIFQRLAIVRARDLQHVALGDTKQVALDKLKQLLASNGGNMDPSSFAQLKKMSLHIDRFYGDVQAGTTVYYLWSGQLPGKVFTGTSQVSSSLPLIVPGDDVMIEYLDSGENVVPISRLQFTPRASGELR